MNVDWIQQITHTRHFEEKWKKIQHCIIFYCFFGEDISKTRASGFIRFLKREKTFETTRPQASWFQINPSPIPRGYPYMFDFRADQANKKGVSSG